MSVKLRLDFASRPSPREAEETAVDKDDAELIIRLCTRAGMIMEDTSLLAVTMIGRDEGARTPSLITLSGAAFTIQALIAAAVALDQHIRG